MTSCVRVLSTQELDSFPSILLVAPNGKKILVNCGEGCQRVFLEFGQKVSTIDTVCLTHLGHEAVGGLPGMILTASDVVKMATDSAKKAVQVADVGSQKQQKQQKSKKNGNAKVDNHKNDSSSLPIQPGLKLLGPEGTYKFFRSLRHFMRRDSFFIDIREGCSSNGTHAGNNEENSHSHDKKRSSGKEKKNNSRDPDDGSFLVRSIAAYTKSDPNTTTDATLNSTIFPSKKRPRTTENTENCTSNITNEPTDPQHATPNHQTHNQHNPHQPTEILSFLFTTPPIQGRFLIENAKALGVPKGPLYGQLKAGKSVSFPVPSPSDGDGGTKIVTVESHQVVAPGSPGVVVAVLCYPSLHILNQLMNSMELKEFQRRQAQDNAMTTNGATNQNQKKKKKNDEKPVLELIVHITTRSVFESDSCVTWRESFFDQSVQHMFVRAEPPTTSMDSEVDTQSLSAFQSAHSGAHLRSKVSPDVFRAPLSKIVKNENGTTDITCQQPQRPLNEEAKSNDSPSVVHAVPLLEYRLLPRAKRGFFNHDLFFQKWKAMEDEAAILLDTSGCIDRAEQILEECKSSLSMTLDEGARSNDDTGGEILFTGTGSAIPCKHRNVSGIYVRMNNGNAMLLDVGEGTIGQLLRAKQRQEYRGKEEKSLADVLKKIKAVWISHPHADHHLGILRLLEERKQLLGDRDPLVLIAPPNILRFLQEYESVEPRVADSYIFLDCRTLNANNNVSTENHVGLQRLRQDLGIHTCKAIPVAHCAYSFAVVFQGTSFGSLAYSGDCRPSKRFAEVAYNADVLIHEATFADGLEADAVVKRHCTVGEALQVGKNMNAKTTILTHFSQRYPKIPVVDTASSTSSLSGDMRVIHAFDFMTITPSNIPAASKLTPALQMLYPDESEDAANTTSEEQSDARAALGVPGLFAQSELL